MRKRPETSDRQRQGEQGASLVEFGLILPIMLVLLFGIIESSWAFAQHNDVRHGAREGARLAAVDHGDVDDIADEICARMDVVYPAAAPTITLEPISTDGAMGGLARITVASTPQSLTGFVDGLIGTMQLTSTIEFRLERPLSGEATWWHGGAGGSHTCAAP